jgi:hypothetical protein
MQLVFRKFVSHHCSVYMVTFIIQCTCAIAVVTKLLINVAM